MQTEHLSDKNKYSQDKNKQRLRRKKNCIIDHSSVEMFVKKSNFQGEIGDCFVYRNRMK